MKGKDVLQHAREKFKNHVATYCDYGDVATLTWAKPGKWIKVPCLVNTKTREIVHVDPFDIGDLQVLQGVWVEVDGVRHEVVEKPETEAEWAEFQRKDAFSWRE